VPVDVFRGLAEWVRGDREERAAVVAPGFVDVAIVRAFEGCDEVVVEWDVVEWDVC
jgi:hypothetical protein